MVAGEPAKRFEPLVSSVGGQWYFWNYSLERAGETEEAGAPRVLVRIRGKVEARAAEPWSDGKPSTMTAARLITAEFVQPEWLRAWARIFKDKRSPFRIDKDRGPVTPAETKAFAPEALAILLAMKGAPGPTAKQRGIVESIDAGARVVERFRTRTEWNIQRWLEDAVEKHGLELPGIKKLGPLPPGTVEIQRWFLEAKDKAGFLAKVRERWKGAPALLTLAYYVTRGSTTSYATVDLAEIIAQDFSSMDDERSVVTSLLEAPDNMKRVTERHIDELRSRHQAGSPEEGVHVS